MGQAGRDDTLVRLTECETGEVVFIRTEGIMAIQVVGSELTVIYMDGGHVFRVCEDVEEIVQLSGGGDVGNSGGVWN